MIVFIAPFPKLSNDKDGLVQRVASIDCLVGDRPRVYLDISFRRFWKKRIHYFGEVKVFQLNGLLHFLVIIFWLKRASVVYIHSLYNSLKVLPAFWIAKCVTDLHGVVPEELAYDGKLRHACLYRLVEHIALRRSSTVVHVTSAMKRHFQRKYGRQSSADRTVAILPSIADPRGDRHNVLGSVRNPNAVIYAGGLQVWQNISMMLDAIAAAPQFCSVLLCGDASALQRLADLKNAVACTIASVPPNEVPDYYLASTYGFVLRDSLLVNRVACPTKLVEYLYWGVIPIVLTPDIGDFNELGFRFVTLEDFKSGQMPNDNEAALMRMRNRQLVEELIESCASEISALRHLLIHG